MKIAGLKNHPTFLILPILLLVIVMGKIPIKEYLAFSNFTSAKLENIIMCSILIFLFIIIIKILGVPHSYFRFIERQDYIYYFPAIIYIVIFTSGFSDIYRLNNSNVYSWQIILYGIDNLSAALFEEILFRGLFLGVLLYRYYNSKNGILKSVIISGVIFGLLHIINIWTQPNQVSIRGTFNQVYAATCLGVMYSAIYIKTRSLIVLSVLHFISNFFASADELTRSEIIVDSIVRDKAIIEIIVSNVLTAIVFGSSLLIGLYILKKTKPADVEELIE